MTSDGVLGESHPDGILANTTASAVCITSQLPVICSQIVKKGNWVSTFPQLDFRGARREDTD